MATKKPKVQRRVVKGLSPKEFGHRPTVKPSPMEELKTPEKKQDLIPQWLYFKHRELWALMVQKLGGSPEGTLKNTISDGMGNVYEITTVLTKIK